MQFSTDLEAATYYGKRARMSDGKPNPEPLSGEWAGGLTPDSVVEFVTAKGFPAPEDDLEYGEWSQELCDAFEEGYFA